MRLEYKVTFEFLFDPPITVSGWVHATTAQTCARLAVKEAKEKAPKRKWSSLTLLLMQRGVMNKTYSED